MVFWDDVKSEEILWKKRKVYILNILILKTRMFKSYKKNNKNGDCGRNFRCSWSISIL